MPRAITVHPEQHEVTRYHAGLVPSPPDRYQRPRLTSAQAARIVEVELLRAVMAEPARR